MKLRAIVKAPSGRQGGAVMRQKGVCSTLEPKEEGPGTPEAAGPSHTTRLLSVGSQRLCLSSVGLYVSAIVGPFFNY